MLQYLINTTAIWLMSLILFDVFLRRESYHNYNRFYLLFTFLLGALLPLIHWQDNNHHYMGTFQKPIEQVITAKQTIVSVSVTQSASVNWQLWITLFYLAGALAALVVLLADVLKMIQFYNKGIRSSEQGWTIITTGKNHTPFSFMNTLFISNRKQYSDEEWNMILIHERRHTSLLHLLDLILMQVSRILFWFNPLVYIYNQRLLMVHEFQADNAAAQKPKAYGSFLIEQAMLHQAPTLSHSFNRSPIKNRIVMLTRKSTTASRTKMLVFVPLVLVCILCFSKNIYSQNQKKILAHTLAFGITDTMRSYKITYDQALENLKVTCKEADCEVIQFSISFLPDRKNGEYVGPYTIKGSNIIQGTGLETLQKFKEEKEPVIKIFIDDIKIKRNGKEESANPLFVRCSLN